MLIKKEDAEERANSESCTIWDYKIPSKLISLVGAGINGRYPKEGFGCNKGSDMIYYVLSGSGTVYEEDESYKISKGDVVYFPMGTAYYVKGDNLLLVVPNAPSFDVEQYKIIMDINEE